jgi:hypothetical protein
MAALLPKHGRMLLHGQERPGADFYGTRAIGAGDIQQNGNKSDSKTSATVRQRSPRVAELHRAPGGCPVRNYLSSLGFPEYPICDYAKESA